MATPPYEHGQSRAGNEPLLIRRKPTPKDIVLSTGIGGEPALDKPLPLVLVPFAVDDGVAQIIDGQVVEEHLRVNGDASVLECVAESANSLAVGMASFEVNVQDLLVVPRTPLVQHHFDTIDDEHGEQTACRRVKELLHLRSQRMRQQRRPPLKKADDVISRKF